MKKRYFLLVIGLVCGSISPLWAQTPPVELTELSLEELLEISLIPHSNGEVDSRASEPVSESTWQLRYRYITSVFEDYLEGTDERTAEEVTDQFPVVPNRIHQQAHVFSLGRQLSEKAGILLETAYVVQKTDHIRRQGDPFTIRTEGLGDSRASAVYRVNDDPEHRIFVTAGTSFPTGSIDEKSDTLRGKNTQVPYTMQLGSGTYDLAPSLAYFGEKQNAQWGGEVRGKIRLGRNDHGYSLGDRITLSSWMHYDLTEWFHPSFRMIYTRWGKIDGRDHLLVPTVAPVANPDLFGGDRLSLLAGFEVHPKGGCLKG